MKLITKQSVTLCIMAVSLCASARAADAACSVDESDDQGKILRDQTSVVLSTLTQQVTTMNITFSALLHAILSRIAALEGQVTALQTELDDIQTTVIAIQDQLVE